jgi:NAD(P)-dependent dehydrogenase (short-subunit alcohol dehydrogenase family)
MGLGRLDGKVAVITGGASGIGEGTVRLFVDEGARVVIADVQDKKGEVLADTLGGRAVYQRTDVTEEVDVKAAVQRAVDEYGRLDCMFNNAGFGGAVGPIEEIPVDEYDKTMNVLLRGVFLGMKHAAPVMKAQGSGSIISTASVAGIKGGDGPHIYSAAKAAVIHLTRSVSLELGESGVRVNCICPGGIATPIFKGAFPDQTVDDATIVESVKPFLKEFQPIKRAGVADDIARAALFLASDESTFVTGHAMVVDGGFTAGRMWSQQPELMRQHRPMSW